MNSLFTNNLQIRDYFIMIFLDFILFSVGFEFLDSFWGSVVDHKGGLVLAYNSCNASTRTTTGQGILIKRGNSGEGREGKSRRACALG